LAAIYIMLFFLDIAEAALQMADHVHPVRCELPPRPQFSAAVFRAGPG
jgi:hypothetical protein